MAIYILELIFISIYISDRLFASQVCFAGRLTTVVALTQPGSSQATRCQGQAERLRRP